MSLQGELKDFSAGMKSGMDFWDKRADSKLKMARAAAYDRQNQPITDAQLAAQPGMGGSTGTGMVDPPQGAVPPPNETYNTFLDTVKTGVTNPYALAAISSTGKHESGYGSQAYSQWDDLGKPSGGIMSWRDDRLANLKKFAGTDNMANIDAATQGKFFLQENPQLIDNLNKASTVADAQHMMNEAWAFQGYRDPGNKEAAGRLADANSYYNQYADAWNKPSKGGTATAAAPTTPTQATGGDTGEQGDGQDGDSNDDQGDDSQEQSKADTKGPQVQQAAAAPVIPVPTQTPMPQMAAATPQQFQPVQGSGFASQQPSATPQPAQQPAAQPRMMNQGAGVSRVAQAMMTPEEEKRQQALQGGQLFADKGGVIPENVGTPTIEQYYADGGKVESTSEWLYNHLPSWLTGEDFGENMQATDRSLGRETQGRAVPVDQKEKDGPPAPPPETVAQRVSRTEKPIRQPPPDRPTKDDTIEPAIPVPDTAATRVSRAAPDLTDRPTKDDTIPQPARRDVSGEPAAAADAAAAARRNAPVPPPPDVSRRRQEMQTMTSGPREPPERLIPPDRPTKDDTIEQTGPVLPTAADTPPQGPPAPRGATPSTPVPITPGAARAAATPQEYEPLDLWHGIAPDDMTALDRRPSQFEGTTPQTPSNPAFVNAGDRGAIPPPEKQGPPAPPRDVITPYTDPNAEATPYVPATDTPAPMGREPPTQDELNNPKPAVATPSPDLVPNQPTGDNRPAPTPSTPAEPGVTADTAGAIPVPGERPANPINGDVPIPQDRPANPPTAVASPRAPRPPDIAARGTRTPPAPTTQHAPQPVQPAAAGGQGRMLNAGSSSPRIYSGSTADQVRQSQPANPRYTRSPGYAGATPHPNPRTVAVAAVATHHGLDWLRHAFGFDKQGVINDPTTEQQQRVGARRFISGAGAVTPAMNDSIDQTLGIDTNQTDGNRLLDRMSRTTQVYLAQGKPKEAKAAAASQLMFASQQFGRLGALSQQSYGNYLQTGDPKYLQQTLDFMTKAHEMIPDGATFGVYVDPQTHKITATHTDAEGHEQTYQVTAQELPAIINGIKDKSTFWQGVENIADPAAARSRLSREATNSRYQQTQSNLDRRHQETMAHQDKMAADRKAAADQKAQQKADADAEKAKNKQIDMTTLAPLVSKLKQAKDAQSGDDTNAVDSAYSDLIDALPKGASVNDRNAILQSAGLQFGGANYLPKEQRNQAPAEEPEKPFIDWSTGNINLGGSSKPAAAAASGTPQRPPGVPADANYSPSKKGWVVKNPKGGYDVIAAGP